jgi:isopenicillin-N epimerase
MPSADLARWTLDPGIHFLNHGSFGACPRAVLEAQAELRARLERNPVDFMVRQLEPLFDAARAELADFLGADPEELIFVPNATHGIATVLASLRLQPGDELLTTSHVYNAARVALSAFAARAGATVREVELPFPLPRPERAGVRGAVDDDEAWAALARQDIVDRVLAAVGPRTRLALLDHVTSPTALILPIERLGPALEARGVPVLVDGAHGPGMLPLALGRLGVSYYTGNLHKWVCAPKGAAFLWARRETHPGLTPLAPSHGLTMPHPDRPRHWLSHDWTGTADFTAYLSVPTALQAMGSLRPGGWPELRAENHAKVVVGRAALLDALRGRPGPGGYGDLGDPPAPTAMLGSMATILLPDAPPGLPPSRPGRSAPPTDALFERFGIEVPISWWPRAPRRILRISGQAYVSEADVARLAEVLPEVLAAER